MIVEATISFCGEICMNKGEVREVSASPTVLELIKIGYLKEKRPRKEKKNDNC